ncbi:sigma-70 family RNA polymerase sigma factor [endosymbiont of Ridgeia piscesae]|jgi:RNA polymerase sigma-70 factor (ECF subfamily)|uniref:RNA polymerase sigma factor, sigma-70 family n=1 Tax=endosymbiont of Ridgeia piscesae TaxID=54398 RepID=A0A0T5Z9P1_9GAMM|nr:sigma-70 family RNA polymerase sigma factor [endosymbiont of Ridgeia piscesae]KRT56536.1 RNA polymerase sigma factor, sigma-70 family [endosymbiont of Ridgeia piscesae]KRT59591.1 RNA polymerase sigma-70 factor, ECF subfamily [endosymbiont of Ridgeia piscesae]
MTAQVEDPVTAQQKRNETLARLLAATSLKDRRAFAELYQLSSAKLYGVVLRILVRDEWAEDCLHEAYMKIWNAAGTYRPDRAAPMTWMSTIVRNQALDLLRRRRREVRRAEPENRNEEVDPGLLPQERLQQSEEGRRLNDCLEQLKANQRQVIVLAYFKGLTHEELSQQTGTPLGTVKTWIRRGLDQLKRCLES